MLHPDRPKLMDQIRSEAKEARCDMDADVKQALVCALLFGKEAGRASVIESRIVKHVGTGPAGCIRIGKGRVVTLSPAAIDLLAAAWVEAQVLGEELYIGYDISQYDLMVQP